MEFTTEQAKSIFDLIKSVSPYAYPLLISLILPIVWISFKKILGISNKEADTTQLKNFFHKIFLQIRSAVTLKGDYAEKFLFYFCIALFLFGGILLKVGEHNEELIRQKALGLKEYYVNRGFTWESIPNLKKRNVTDHMLDDILFNYPEEFLRIDDFIYCTDTSVMKKNFDYIFPLLESYLNYQFKTKKQIYSDSLNKGGIENYFTWDIVYDFLAHPSNRGKYDLDVINGKTVIMKGDAYENKSEIKVKSEIPKK